MSSPHAHSDAHEEHDDAPEWIRDYNATLAKRAYQKPTPPGPHCCSSASRTRRAQTCGAFSVAR
jgi:hypothetical protein